MHCSCSHRPDTAKYLQAHKYRSFWPTIQYLSAMGPVSTTTKRSLCCSHVAKSSESSAPACQTFALVHRLCSFVQSSSTAICTMSLAFALLSVMLFPGISSQLPASSSEALAESFLLCACRHSSNVRGRTNSCREAQRQCCDR